MTALVRVKTPAPDCVWYSRVYTIAIDSAHLE